MADSVCPDNGDLCRWVEDTTHSAWLAQSANWLIAKPLSILMLIVIGVVARWLTHRLINRVAQRAASGTIPAVIGGDRVHQMFLEHNESLVERRQQRADTTASLLKSISTGVIASIVVVMIIAQLGYNIAPLIASAGIIGVALGFGAQSLVKDFLSGIFLFLEDQYAVGDVVNVGAATGTVEAVGLRVTRLRDVNGTVWYVRNGEILAVGNMSQLWARTVLDIPVAFSADLSRVRELLVEVADEVWQDPDHNADIIEQPEVWGVERWDPDGVVVRLVVKTVPAAQTSIARALRERIKDRFEAEGIEVPQRIPTFNPAPPSNAAQP